MTVKELIEALSHLPEDAPVGDGDGYEYNDVSFVDEDPMVYLLTEND